MRISWVHPEVAERVRATLRAGRSSWEDVFDSDELKAVAPPHGVEDDIWPSLAEHVARAERVREVVAHAGLEAAERRFGGSPHAIERAALLEAYDRELDGDLAAITGVLGCAIDEWLAYGAFLSRLVELGAGRDPAGTVGVFERFVAAASALTTSVPSWPERLRVARDGLAALYVRVGRVDDAEALYHERYREEPLDTTIAIGAARAFLEAGDTGRALVWLRHALERAESLGRTALAAQLRSKVDAVQRRMN